METSSSAGAGQKLGLASLILRLSGYLCLPLLPLGLILGVVALRRMGNSHPSRRWLAQVGVVVSVVNLAVLSGVGVWGYTLLPRFRCNRNLGAIGKALSNRSVDSDGTDDGSPREDSEILAQLLSEGAITEAQAHCPLGGRYIVHSPQRAEETGIIAYGPTRNHRGERGVLHLQREISRAPPTFTNGQFHTEYVVLWLTDPLPEKRFQKIMEQEFGEAR